MALNYTADADVDINDLEGERVRQAALMAFWNQQHYEAVLAYKAEKTDFDSYEANMYLMIKAQLQERALRDGGKATVTEAGIDREIRRNTAWIERKLRLAVREAEIDRIKGVMTALTHKKDMLVSLALGQRQEMRSMTQLAA